MKRRMKAKVRRKGPTHQEVRAVCASCQEGKCDTCIDPNCACEHHTEATNEQMAQHLHLKKHGEVKVESRPLEAEVVPQELQMPLLFKATDPSPARRQTPRDRPLVGSRLFPGLREARARQRKV